MTARMKASSKAEIEYHYGEADEYVGFTMVLPIKPVPASRPRVTRWGTYYLKTYKTYKDAAHEAIPVCKYPPLTGELSASIEFVCHKPRTTKLASPRGDIDNHMKAILDAVVGQSATKKVACKLKNYIEDDELISFVRAKMRYVEKGETPHTLISIGVLNP